MSLAFKAQRFLQGASEPPWSRVAAWMAPCSVSLVGQLIPDSKYAASQLWADTHRRCIPVDDTQHALRSFQRYYLADGILAKVDRASSMHSLEVRSPFLDRDLVEYVNRLPSSLKFRNRQTKYLLRKIVGDNKLMPASILQRKKKGFGVPVSSWIRSGMQGSVSDALLSNWPDGLGMFDQKIIRRLLERHSSGRANYSKELWALLMLSQWGDRHLGTTTHRLRSGAHDNIREIRLPPRGQARAA